MYIAEIMEINLSSDLGMVIHLPLEYLRVCDMTTTMENFYPIEEGDSALFSITCMLDVVIIK